mgnify:CR=1 FL=1
MEHNLKFFRDYYHVDYPDTLWVLLGITYNEGSPYVQVRSTSSEYFPPTWFEYQWFVHYFRLKKISPTCEGFTLEVDKVDAI